MLDEAALAQFRLWGAEGGRKRAAKLSKKRRREIAILAVRARERKRKAAPAQ